MLQSLSDNLVIDRLSNAVAAGQTDINSASVDMQGRERALFLVAFGAIVAGAATTIKLQSSSDDGVADAFADITGASKTIAATDDNKIGVLEIENPAERYIRLVVTRATQDSTVDAIVALLGGTKKLPVTQTADVVDGGITVGG